VQLDSKAVKVTDVQRAEITVEGIVQQSLVDAKVDRRERLSASTSGSGAR
jgi:hypothetical protein